MSAILTHLWPGAVLAARKRLRRLCRPWVHRKCPCRRPLPDREWWDDIQDRAWPHAEWAIVLLDFSREQERRREQ